MTLQHKHTEKERTN